ncbi:SDR family NAD(P)-dependent oxidoreductase [Celerinatantimonas sp. MCCC 1A17872]|uniref:SDR family NAD(P)-dependent oxidoreductase n=1 Tax=Celerinatantimonas sp. MCCC 1A17872 TaxID=3177514 RepID=UPI0038BEF748
MQINLADKLAIVTGSTKGIGLATATGLAQCGAKVVVNGRTDEAVQSTIAKIKQTVVDAQLIAVAADLGSSEGCDKLIQAQPQCDILVNNMGIFGPKDFFETDDSVWQQYFDVNVMSGVRLARHYLPAMAEKHWGRVVFLSSESAFNIPADMIHYGFSKTACTSIARGLAKRMAGTGVTVNSVLPGPTMSEGVADMLKDQAEQSGQSLEQAGIAFVKANRPSSVIQRMASTEEVANMIVYACSELSSATSGAALRVDGGVVDSIAP